MEYKRVKMIKQTPCCYLKTALLSHLCNHEEAGKYEQAGKRIFERKCLIFKLYCWKHQILNSEKVLQSLLCIGSPSTLIIDKCDFSSVVEVSTTAIRNILWNDESKEIWGFSHLLNER